MFLFGKNRHEANGIDSNDAKNEKKTAIDVVHDGNSLIAPGFGKITIGSATVGTKSGGTKTDYYVYEWYVKETGEIFYVGKGRGDRYKEYHERAYEAERIRKEYKTEVRFVAQGLSEEQALEIETNEMCRVLNETNDRLTNRIIPFFTKRDNGYGRSPSTPPFQFEKAPILYASEIEEHYFGVEGRPFDQIQREYLIKPSFVEKSISREELETVYGGQYEKYRTEVNNMLNAIGSSIVRTRFAKSVTAWIYCSDDYVTNNDIDEESAIERIGHRVPSYHLIDVWKFLNAQGISLSDKKEDFVPRGDTNNRVPLAQINNLHDWKAGFDAGFHFWEEGDCERKKGNLTRAIELFDEARYNGYFSPALYNSYAMAYRKLKDVQNEIAILEEGIERCRAEKGNYSQTIIHLEEQRQKALLKLKKAK